jgi:hypothetical protein
VPTKASIASTSSDELRELEGAGEVDLKDGDGGAEACGGAADEGCFAIEPKRVQNIRCLRS